LVAGAGAGAGEPSEVAGARVEEASDVPGAGAGAGERKPSDVVGVGAGSAAREPSEVAGAGSSRPFAVAAKGSSLFVSSAAISDRTLSIVASASFSSLESFSVIHCEPIAEL
jgi:hypothetical protein